MTTVEYGTTRKGLDHAIVYSQKKFELTFSGQGTIDDSPNLDLYLLRDDRESQAFYVPEKTLIQVNWRGLIYDETDGVYEEVYEVGGLIYRGANGDIQYTGGEIDSGTALSITPTANTTVQGLELVVSADGGADASEVGILLVGECTCLNGYTYKQLLPEAATTALTSAE